MRAAAFAAQGKFPASSTAPVPSRPRSNSDHNDLFHALRKEAFHSSILDLEIDGSAASSVLLRDVQMHPFKQQVLHVDFQRISATEKIHVRVPIHYINAEVSPAVKMSANVISHVMNDIEVVCLPKDLPGFIEVDLAALEAQGAVHVSDLKLPEGVTVSPNADEVIATATMPQEMVEIAPAVAEVEATPAAGAAPAGEKSDKGGDKK